MPSTTTPTPVDTRAAAVAFALPASPAYARTIEASKRMRWDIDRDVIRGRELDFDHKFLPDGLSLVRELDFLDAAGQRLLSQVQGRTYANMFALVERFIGAKMLEVTRDHWLGDQTALEALVRLTDEELKHQELFRRFERMISARMPEGYRFEVQPDEVARFVLGKCTWAVLALTCDIELFSQSHYRASIGQAEDLSPLFKDVFLYHWREESQHAVIDELEWAREDGKLADDAQRDAAVDDLIALVAGLDGILQLQANADSAYFTQIAALCGDEAQVEAVHRTVLKAYRWQYVVSGVTHPRFQRLLARMVSDAQMQRLQAALAPLAYAMPQRPDPDALQ